MNEFMKLTLQKKMADDASKCFEPSRQQVPENDDITISFEAYGSSIRKSFHPLKHKDSDA